MEWYKANSYKGIVYRLELIEWVNDYIWSKNQNSANSIVYVIRLFYLLAMTAGLLAPTVSFIDTYDAWCSDNDCEITINEFGFSGPKGFIPKEKIFHNGIQLEMNTILH